MDETPKPTPPTSQEDDYEPHSLKVYLIGIAVLILAVLGLTWFMLDFADWNKQQACATAGRRNCGGDPIQLTQ